MTAIIGRDDVLTQAQREWWRWLDGEEGSRCRAGHSWG